MAYSSSGIAAALFAGLVLSLVSDDGDDLATVALILAVVAFSLQIVFFMVQLWVAGEQNRRGQELARQTGEVLTRIDGRLNDTVDVIKNQFAFVLEHALGGRTLETDPPHARELSGNDDDVGEDEGEDDEGTVEAKLAELTRSVVALTDQQRVIDRWRRVSASAEEDADNATHAELKARAARFRRWPPREVGIEAVTATGALSDEGIAALRMMARNEMRRARSGNDRRGHVVNEQRVADELVTAGLTRRQLVRDPMGHAHYRLAFTPLGEAAASTLMAVGEVPEWAEPLVERFLPARDGESPTGES